MSFQHRMTMDSFTTTLNEIVTSYELCDWGGSAGASDGANSGMPDDAADSNVLEAVGGNIVGSNSVSSVDDQRPLHQNAIAAANPRFRNSSHSVRSTRWRQLPRAASYISPQ